MKATDSQGNLDTESNEVMIAGCTFAVIVLSRPKRNVDVSVDASTRPKRTPVTSRSPLDWVPPLCSLDTLSALCLGTGRLAVVLRSPSRLVSLSLSLLCAYVVGIEASFFI